MKKNVKNVILTGIIGAVCVCGIQTAYAGAEPDENVTKAVSAYFTETESALAKESAVRAYCIGKTKEEAEKYVELGEEKYDGSDGVGTVCTIVDKDFSMYYGNQKGSEDWHFGEDGKLECIHASFDFAGDSHFIHMTEDFSNILGQPYSFTNNKIGIGNNIWECADNVEMMLSYNFTGSDASLDDGLLRLNLMYMANDEEQQKKKPEKNQEEKPEKSVKEETPTEIIGTVYTDSATVKIVQQALNAKGYNCGTPDGIAGAKTTEQINAYETASGINVNGVITDELLDSLGVAEEIKAAAEKEAQKGQYSADYTYDQLARNPDTYKGKKVKMSGKVLQAETSDDICYARVALNSNYDTIIFVTYEKDLLGYRLLEDDMITVYGASLGVYSYEAVSGATITIPWVNADIIEM